MDTYTFVYFSQSLATSGFWHWLVADRGYICIYVLLPVSFHDQRARQGMNTVVPMARKQKRVVSLFWAPQIVAASLIDHLGLNISHQLYHPPLLPWVSFLVHQFVGHTQTEVSLLKHPKSPSALASLTWSTFWWLVPLLILPIILLLRMFISRVMVTL